MFFLLVLFFSFAVDSVRLEGKAFHRGIHKCINEDIRYDFEEFLGDYTNEDSGYVYFSRVDEIRSFETPHLNGSVYLDYTGAGVYQKKQIMDYSDHLLTKLYGNTHSRSPSSIRSDEMVALIRRKILEFFGTNEEEYSVVFTSGATGALRIVAESFRWDENSLFFYTNENHNSVVGIREIVLEHGGRFSSISEEKINNILLRNEIFENNDEEASSKSTSNLFAFPAESNFSGKKYDLEWIKKIIEERKRKLPELGSSGDFYVLLDAAAFVSTNQLNLTEFPADFVPISFYKMFGFPTGVGCLLVKNSAGNAVLRKGFWGGGTVTLVSPDTKYRKIKSSITEKFEDGSLNFLSILALEKGLDVLEEIGMENIEAHVNILTKYAYDKLSAFSHPKSDGEASSQKLIEVYGNHHLKDNNSSKQGSIISFNVFKKNGDYVSHRKVMLSASKRDIHVRSGAHCNPGGMKVWLGWNKSEMFEEFGELLPSSGLCTGVGITSSQISFILGENVPTGSVRVSIGYLTTFEDVYVFLKFIEEKFTEL